MATGGGAAKTRVGVIKFQNNETEKFLELYSGEPVLFDSGNEEYRSKELRLAAARRISAALDIPGFGPKEVVAKFKNLRSSYCQELKKIADSERTAAGTDDVYRPKVFWFDQMNAFIRPFVQQRPTPLSNSLSRTNPKDESYLDHYESVLPSPQEFSDSEVLIEIKTEAEIEAEPPRPMRKHKMPPLTIPQHTPPKQMALHNPPMVCPACPIENVESISNRAELIQDSYDCFGKYVASMLRSVGPPTSMRLQETITSVIINAMCPATDSD